MSCGSNNFSNLGSSIFNLTGTNDSNYLFALLALFILSQNNFACSNNTDALIILLCAFLFGGQNSSAVSSCQNSCNGGCNGCANDCSNNGCANNGCANNNSANGGCPCNNGCNNSSCNNCSCNGCWNNCSPCGSVC